MIRREFPGGIWGDALPAGEYACLVGDHLETHLGVLPWAGPDHRPIYLRIAAGPFRIAAVSNTTDRVVMWADGQWLVTGVGAIGVSPLIYGGDGVLRVVTPDLVAAVGTQGYRYVDPTTGRLVTGDETYGPRDGILLFEWTDLGQGWRVGQGPETDVWAYHDGRYLKIGTGDVRNVRATTDGVRVALAWRALNAPSMAVWTSFTELTDLLERDGVPAPTPAPTPVPVPVPEPPAPPPVVPVPEPIPVPVPVPEPIPEPATPTVTPAIVGVVAASAVAAILAYLKSRRNLPTDAEVIAALESKADQIIAAGESWLAAHREVV